MIDQLDHFDIDIEKLQEKGSRFHMNNLMEIVNDFNRQLKS